jgi:hypothetical protein
MDLHELNARLKKGQATEEQLQQITPLYITLDLDKDIFCKMVDAVGVDVISAYSGRWNWLQEARDEKLAKEQFVRDIDRFDELTQEIECVKKRMEAFRKRAAQYS